MTHFTLPFQDPVLIFGTVMFLILGAPFLARKAKLPEILGLIAAGVLVGPFGLGLLERDASIELLGKVGLLYIMFQAGLEIDLHQVKRNMAPTLIFGLITFAIPLFLGTLLGYILFGMTLAVAVLLASMFSSHTLITFPAAAKLGLTKTPSVTMAVGGTIITDTLALIILAVVVSSSHSTLTPLYWVKLFSLMIVYMGGTLLIIPRIGRWFFSRMGIDEEVEFVFVIALTFTASYLAHLAGLEPIIGAFLAGLSLNSLIPEKSLLMTRIHFTGNAIFIPFFLISVGMLVNLRLLASGPAVWIIILGMSVTAVLSKYLAAGLARVIFRQTKAEGALVFGLTVNQAAATLAAVLVGYDAGLFTTNVITGTIFMIGVTCLLGSLVTQRAGRQVILEEEQADFDESSAPSRILIPLGKKEGAKELLDLSLLLHREQGQEPIYPLRVTGESLNLEKDLADAEKILAHSVVRAMSANIPVTPLTAVDINRASGIVRAARENRISLISADWDGVSPGGSRTFGHVLDEVVEQSRQMVLVSRLVQPVSSVKRIIVLLPPLGDRQTGFERKLGVLKTLAHQTGAKILLLCSHETINTAGDFMKRKQPRVPLELAGIPVWKKASLYVEERLQKGDWLFLMSSRKGDLAWQPSLDRFPRIFAEQFPHHNLSIIYPPDQRWDPSQAAQTVTNREKLLSGFTPERTLLQIEAANVETAVKKLVSRDFGRRHPATASLTSILHKISQEEPVELTEDVILLHTHVPFVEDSTIYLGVTKEPMDIPLSSNPPHILIILLDPVGQDPAQHLKALADIARIIRISGMVQALREIRSFEEMVKLVEEKLIQGNS